jgi:hypothetical protein
MAGRSSDHDERVLRARMAAHLLHARVKDSTEHTASARTAFLSRFEREVDPDGVLEPAERFRRAEHAKKAYFLRALFRTGPVEPVEFECGDRCEADG